MKSSRKEIHINLHPATPSHQIARDRRKNESTLRTPLNGRTELLKNLTFPAEGSDTLKQAKLRPDYIGYLRAPPCHTQE